MKEVSHFEVEPGSIKIEDKLPEVFKDTEIRSATDESLERYRAENDGKLPLKFEIEEFCFKREDQICTADSERKYIAWAGKDQETAFKVFDGLKDGDTPLVLRSHAQDYGITTPAFQITTTGQVEEHLNFLRGNQSSSKLQKEFFGKIKPEKTVVQLLKNAYLQRGNLLIRPTFVYDPGLKKELLAYQDPAPQSLSGRAIDLPTMPEAFVGMRVVAIEEFAREKKDRMGVMFIYNPKTRALEARGGLPYAEKEFLEGGAFEEKRGELVGRTLDLSDSSTKIHHENLTRVNTDHLRRFISRADIEFLQKILAWQMPRIAKFEVEIREQDWIPQGFTTTHQFMVFPPQKIPNREINTQYFDFRAHESRKEMDDLVGAPFEELPTEEKIMRFF